MKSNFAILLVTIAALGAGGAAAADTLPAQRQAREQQDEARYRVCDAQRADNRATNTVDFTSEGRRCLISALDQAASVQGTLVLLRNASVTLRKNPDDAALRAAALRAVGKAREQLVLDHPRPFDRFTEQAAALDQAEFSIHLPQVHHEQQMWRLEAFWGTGKVARKD